MNKLNWEGEIELHKGQPLQITYPVDAKEGHGEWDDLDLGMGVSWTGNTVNVPKHQFLHNTKVQDVVRANWNGGVPKWKTPCSTQPPKPKPGAIVIVLESPHADEYDYSNGQFIPQEPLTNNNSQILLRCHLVRLVLAAAATKKVILEPKADIVLCNPIQFQTSLHRLVQQNVPDRDKVRQAIRNGVWRGLWRYKVGTSQPFQDEFESRLKALAPRLVLNASTCELRPDLRKFFSRMHQLPVVEVTNHPSRWSCDTVVGPCGRP